MLTFSESLMPRLYRIRQNRQYANIEDPRPVVEEQMQPYLGRIKSKGKIGIAAGSRGIFNYDLIIKAVADCIKKAGATPVIIPAMGSHGGATAEGQIDVLKSYGVTEDKMGAAVISSMETIVVGHTDAGVPVYFDKNASSLDGVIMVNRIKPHTDFHAEIESGLMKQMVIGLGKRDGASTIHRRGVRGLMYDMPASARVIMDKMNILMGVGILENELDRTAKIEVIPTENIEAREKELLVESRTFMPCFPCTDIDVLVLSEMGKNISGTGIDPNIVGRTAIHGVKDADFPKIYRIVVLDLTEESHNNAIGVGIADMITKRMYDKIDLEPTYINTITSGFLERGFIPVVADSDRDAVEISLNCANRFVSKEDARLVFCKNTLSLKELVVSEAIMNELKTRKDIEILGEETPQWDEKGYLSRKMF